MDLAIGSANEKLCKIGTKYFCEVDPILFVRKPSVFEITLEGSFEFLYRFFSLAGGVFV